LERKAIIAIRLDRGETKRKREIKEKEKSAINNILDQCSLVEEEDTLNSQDER